MVENTDGAFVLLERLSVLSLGYNKITHISRDAFSGLTNLNQLDLSGNPIASIQENAFHTLPKLKELLINSSSLICDCTIGWFRSWLYETSVHVRRENLRCSLPPKLKKKMFHHLSSTDFDCCKSNLQILLRHGNWKGCNSKMSNRWWHAQNVLWPVLPRKLILDLNIKLW